MRKKSRLEMTFGYWLTIAKYSGFQLEAFSRPAVVGGVFTPETLNDITIGQLIQLSELSDDNESAYDICNILLGLDREKVSKARAVDVVRFCGWVMTEAERINKIFQRAEIKPTAEEQQAGIERLRFGLFGMIDSYARRMGISNHDDVMNVSWMKVYKCTEIDNSIVLFNRRLNDVYARKMQRKTR